MTEYFENPSDLIFFIPKSQYRWGYKIDNGKQHIILQDDIIKFVKKYIDKKYINTLKDILMRHQPFIILIEQKEVVELHKDDDTLLEQHKKLELEINSIPHKNKNNFSNDKLSDDIFSSMINNYIKI